MAGPDAPTDEIYVQPGESHLVTQPAVLRTILGSCVGITFLVPRLGKGALCHPMMPKCPSAQLAGLSVHAGRRYVDFAIRDMARQLDRQGATRAEAVVKLFGGNDVLTVEGNDPRGTIGKQNSEAALRVLAEEGFTVTASCLGGTTGVHITFETATGEVLLRRLDSGTNRRTQMTGRTTPHPGKRR
jgi:chemotaxis protein CheD